MALTPERRAQISARVDAIINRRKRPKVVTSEGQVIRDANVYVSPVDPNVINKAKSGKYGDQVIAVRRSDDWCTINMAAYERQRADEEAQRIADRRRKRELDPFNYGHWGPNDDE
jgi:hypothetical protein